MCGISGLFGGFVPRLMSRMNSLLHHRGPDGAGVYEDPQIGAALGHVRLAILDLSPMSAQPMETPEGRFVLVFNGEIYNYRDLRDELASRGVTFKSNGDTEVLLRGLETYGEPFIEKLNGIFAFALWDKVERKLLLARDHAGVKPLYYAEPAQGTLLFASEIKAMLAHPQISRRPNFMAIQEHLTFCHATGNDTAIESIRRVPAGSVLRWNAATRKSEIAAFWTPRFSRDSRDDYSDSAERLRSTLSRSVQRQLVSDVPLGSFLSGGLDSSLITAMAMKSGSSALDCYTIVYPASENVLDNFADDAPYARQVAAELRATLHEIEIKPDVAGLLPKLLYHLDEPLADPAILACFLISRMARERGTKVLLSGQGADELFGGYPRYAAMQLTGPLKSMPGVIRRGLAAGARKLPGGCGGKAGSLARRVRRVMGVLDQDADTQFLNYCATSPYAEVEGILSAAFRAETRNVHPFERCLQRMNERNLNSYDRYLDRDFSVYLPNHNLLYTDKIAMAVGLEARVPILDLELLQNVPSMPYAWKVRRGKTKVILREAARTVVDQKIIDRPKAGFGAPYRKWLRDDLEPIWNDVLSDRATRQRGWFDAEGLRSARERSIQGRTDLYMLQWAALSVELWAREFLDRNFSSAE
jgi:asparagine synthase (glutamine-hydrolysing)